MESVNYHRPHRAVIRSKVKMQLLEAVDDCLEWNEPFDDTLLKDLATSLFQSNRYRGFFETYHSKQEVNEIEDQMAQELAAIYQNILKRHQDPLVQSLNALL
jgi:hypothetical protein